MKVLVGLCSFLMISLACIALAKIEFMGGLLHNEWEQDYIQDFFPQSRFNYTHNSSSPGVALCNHRGWAPKLKDLMATTNISIIVQLSDEYMGEAKQARECYELYPRVKLVLRQYAYWASDPRPHVIQIPLGYMVNMLRGEGENVKHSSVLYAQWSLSVPMSLKKYNWTFVGNTGRVNRTDMLTVFSTWNTSSIRTQAQGRLDPHEMAILYNASRFVVVGRGHLTLDCFRIYEAIICGAIPVVVGPPAEVEKTFYFNGYPPPLVTASSWEAALEICRGMTAAEAEERRTKLVLWYVETMHRIQSLVDKVFPPPTRMRLL